MIDTHAHIYLPQLEPILNELLQRADDAGVSHILMPGIEELSWQQMNAIHNPTKVKLYNMFGIHPCDVAESVSDYEKLVFTYCGLSECIAVGETGLDYYWSKERISQQKLSLRIHCTVAKELGKPIVLHNRESTTDLLDLIEQEQDGRLTGVWHCFTGTEEEGRRALDLGLHLGIGGVITFKNGGVDKSLLALKDEVQERLVLETDTPYLTPTPHRGKTNEPSYLPLIVKKLANCLEKSESDVIDETTTNAKKLFKIG